VNCGRFDPQRREYVITTPRTPVKWINYVGTLSFGGFVDQTGGGVICRGDPAHNRIVKYLPQLPLADFNGETLYVRVREPTGYRVFSAFHTPTLDPFERYECRVGLGYNHYSTRFYGLEFEITVFVPAGASAVVRKIQVTNRRDGEVEVDLIPVVEYSHFDALKQFTNADWVPQTMQSRAIRQKDGRLVLTQCAYMKRGRGENFYTSNRPVSSFDSARALFLGDGGYGSFARPQSLFAPELSGSEAQRGDNIGALLHRLGRLAPEHTQTLITQLGQVDRVEDALAEIEKYRDEGAVDRALEETQRGWSAYLDRLQIQTPSLAMDDMINVHNPRQCYITQNWSRDLSLYQLGLGGRGMGFRDSSQDSMGTLTGAPEESRSLMEKILAVQKQDGSAMHQFYPQTLLANEGDAREHQDRPKYYGDDHLWIVLAVCAYLRETGRFDFLDEVIPFYDKDAAGNPLESGTVLGHLTRALSFTQKNRGRHGLPLLGFADWNDTINLRAGAESVMIACQYGLALREMIEVLTHLGDSALAGEYRGAYAQMKKLFNDSAWDGEWFVRYFDHDGEALGTQRAETGKIFINSQSWSVLAGFADPERGRRALDSVRQHLNTPCGIKLFAPGYRGFDPDIGGVTTYPPGAKENGGIFLHTNPWVIMAEAVLGRGERAFEYYLQINPAAKNEIIEIYECEPYCYAQNILGDEHPQFGLGRNSWLSGTASWMYQAATQYILGIRPTCAGLRVDPCIPPGWKEFRVRREFRGALYEIAVHNPGGVSKGVRSLRVDDETLVGSLVPAPREKKTYRVEVLMG